MQVKFISEDFLVVFKPHNLPTVPLKTQKDTDTLLKQVSNQYPEVLTVHGKNEWEGSTLHRLDTATEGLVVFARNQKTYNYLYDIQQSDKMQKVYLAKCSKETNAQTVIKKVVETYFRSFGPKGKMVKAEKDSNRSDNGILYRTTIENLSENTFECTITRGFRHQIRVHLASIGYPILGDDLYNKDKKEGDLQLSCVQISFPLENGNVFSFRNSR